LNFAIVLDDANAEISLYMMTDFIKISCSNFLARMRCVVGVHNLLTNPVPVSEYG